MLFFNGRNLEFSYRLEERTYVKREREWEYGGVEINDGVGFPSEELAREHLLSDGNTYNI